MSKTSVKKITANRLNAKKSTGPKTSQGKKKSALNSIKHGLCSNILLLPNENPMEWKSFLNDIFETFHPKNSFDSFLVENLAVLCWRKRRIIAAESEIYFRFRQKDQEKYSNEVSLYHDQENTKVLNFGSVYFSESLNVLSRYETSLDKAITRTLEQIKTLRNNSDLKQELL